MGFRFQRVFNGLLIVVARPGLSTPNDRKPIKASYGGNVGEALGQLYRNPGGGEWESNPPRAVRLVDSFEDCEAHQDPCPSVCGIP